MEISETEKILLDNLCKEVSPMLKIKEDDYDFVKEIKIKNAYSYDNYKQKKISLLVNENT